MGEKGKTRVCSFNELSQKVKEHENSKEPTRSFINEILISEP